MAILPNGLETIEIGSTTWRVIINNNLTKLYTKDEVDNDFATKTSCGFTWNALTLQNSWVAYGSPSESPSYTKNEYGIVALKGGIKDGSTGTVCATLPAGYRPAATRGFITYSLNSTPAFVLVAANGEITIESGDTTGLSLDGIMFVI